MPRPEYVQEEHLVFLDVLRSTGQVNMFGARPYLAEEFELSTKDATNILKYWMESFGKEDR